MAEDVLDRVAEARVELDAAFVTGGGGVKDSVVKRRIILASMSSLRDAVCSADAAGETPKLMKSMAMASRRRASRMMYCLERGDTTLQQ